MNRFSRFSTVFVLAIVAASSAAVADTTIRDANNKRLLFIDGGDTIRPDAGGKRLLFIDDGSIRPEPGGKRLLFVDGDDVRPEPGGIRLAFIDSDGDVRRRPGGKVLLNYHHPDICPTAHDKRIYFVDGDKLTNAQLVAVLYQLKPDLFKLSDEETAKLKKEMADAGKEEDAKAAADQVAGKWDILSGSGVVSKIDGGVITVGPKKGDAYPITLDHTKKGGPLWTGAGVYLESKGDKLFFAAHGTPKTIGLCVYEIKKGGTLEGKWYPWYIDGDAKNVGVETLKGPESLNGEFKILSAKSPATGVAYTGTVTIKPADEIVGASDNTKPYNITWTIGKVTIKGIGIRSHDHLFVSSGSGVDVNIAAYEVQNGGIISGDWFKMGTKERGISAASKSN